MARGYIPTTAPRASSPLNLVQVMATPPTVTLSAANAATSITGATLRSPLAGTGTAVDMAGDRTYQWSGVPTMAFMTGINALFTQAPTLTGTTSNIRYAPSVAFNFNGDKFEILLKALGTTHDYRLRVDGQLVTEHATRLTLTSGAEHRLIVDFGSVGNRVVQFDWFGNGVAGVVAAPAHSVSRARHLADIPTVILGDSISSQANSGTAAGYTRVDTWATTAAAMLGWRDIRNVAIPGTGFVNASTEAAFTSRLADLQAPGARFVVYGGLNDVASVATTLPAAIDTVFGAIRGQAPAEFIVIGCHPKNGDTYANTAYVAVNDLLRAKAAQYGARFIDPFDLRPLNGNGNATTPNGTGNADLFVNADNLHPTRAGAQYLGRVYAEAIKGAN